MRKQGLPIISPNHLTLARVAATPIIVALFGMNRWENSYWVFFLFLVASATDFLDGYIARRYGLCSQLGSQIDPLADKLLIGSTIVILAANQKIAIWLAAVLILRDAAITVHRYIAGKRKQNTKASKSAKAKTAMQIAGLLLLLLPFAETESVWHSFGTAMLYVAAALSLYSAFRYLQGSWPWHMRAT